MPDTNPRAGSPRDTQRLRGGSEPLARRPLPFGVPRCSVPHQGSCPQHSGHGGGFLCSDRGMNHTGVRISQAEAHPATATLLGGTPREPSCPKRPERIHRFLVSQHESDPALVEAGHPQALWLRQICHRSLFKAGGQVPGAHLLPAPLWKRGERGTRSHSSFTMEECKAGSPVGREKPPGKKQMVLAPAHVRMCRAH